MKSASSSERRHRGGILGFAVAALLGVTPAPAAEVTFRLVPLEHFPARDAEDVLTSGTVYLYAHGAYEPELSGPVNEPISIPVGTWHWIAEAPGYVTVAGGTLSLGQDTDLSRSLLWPVVPACRYRLDEDPAWRRLNRVDVVSLDHHAVYPEVPGTRRHWNVPTGPAIAYTMGPRGLVAIARLEPCRQGEERVLEPPAPPARDRQSLLVQLVLPDDPNLDRGSLEVFVERGPSSQPIPADARVRSGRRVSAFFLDLPADAEHQLHVRHPALRGRSLPIAPLGGSVREVSAGELAPRRDVAFSVDYQPLAPHREAHLEAAYCGRRQDLRRPSMKACRPLDVRLPLVPGLERYVFEGLDDGLYVVSAVIDGEVIHGLGRGFFPFLDPATDEPFQEPERFTLRELEIWGHLLRDGEPVDGEVRLLPIADDWPVRRFPTDEERLYRLTYFGQPPFGRSLPAGADRGDPELLGLYWFYHLAACDALGSCLVFDQESTIRGGGRLDLELGRGGRLWVKVIDAETAAPLPEAAVSYTGPGRRLTFERGRAEVETVEQRPGVTARTDSRGEIRVHGLPPGRTKIRVDKEGYEGERDLEVEILPDEVVTAQVLLRREDDGAPRDLVFRFRSGEPVGKGFLLALGEDGTWSRCSTALDGQGGLDLEPGCPEDGLLVLLHPRARVTPFDPSRLRTSATLEVEAAPRPVEVRFVDQAGAPVPGVWPELRFDGFRLGVNEFLLARGRAGFALATASGPDGVSVIHGLDPEAPQVPSIVPAGSDTDGVPLSAYPPGAVIEITVP